MNTNLFPSSYPLPPVPLPSPCPLSLSLSPLPLPSPCPLTLLHSLSLSLLHSLSLSLSLSPLPSLSQFHPLSFPRFFSTTSAGILVQLCNQYPRSVSEPAIYDNTRVHHDSTPSMRKTGNSLPDLSVRHVVTS